MYVILFSSLMDAFDPLLKIGNTIWPYQRSFDKVVAHRNTFKKFIKTDRVQIRQILPYRFSNISVEPYTGCMGKSVCHYVK
jgi:hypothetical protein